MPPKKTARFPGEFGKDYRLVSYGGKVYIVYILTLPGGKALEVSWRLSDEALKDFGVSRDKIRHISKTAFQRMQHLGSWDTVSEDLLPDEHPFSTWLKRLQKIHGEVSWLSDPKFMATLIEGYAEGWSDQELQQALEQTHWYQSRTDRQVEWETQITKSQRRSEVKTITQQLSDALRDLYGADFSLKDAGITQAKIKKWAEDIASGKWGDPTEGLSYWFARQQAKAREVEGTPAWIEAEQALEEQRAFLNRPEDVFLAIKEQAKQWLGPLGVPSNETLKQWAADLVSEKKSDADWMKFLTKRAKTLYPFLGDDESWQEFADPYKGLLENTWGTPIDWDSPLLQQLGRTDESGKPTGEPLSFYEFEVLARQDPRFWQGPVAREEGYSLLNRLNEVFRGVTS